MRPRLAALSRRLAEARKALRSASRFPEAIAAGGTRSTAKRLHIPSPLLQAEARLLTAHLRADTNLPSEEEAHEALELAESVGADRVPAGAAIRLA